jgi:5-methylcytosine-specific restriction endonuclease McrA
MAVDKKAYMRKWRAEHREEINARRREYAAEHREEKAAADRKYYAGYREECNARSRKYHAEHREEIAAKKREYRAEHQEELKADRRARYASDVGYAGNRASSSRVTAARRGAVIDPELTTAILAKILRDRDSCNFCLNPVSLHDRMIDHRHAIYFGGAHTASNIQILCKPCEKQKSSAEKSLIAKLRNGATQSDFALAA